jgi:hypothetical protein
VGATTLSFTKSLGKDAEYIYGSTMWLPEFNIKDPLWGDSNNLVKLYEEKYNGEVPDDHVAMAAGSAISSVKRLNRLEALMLIKCVMHYKMERSMISFIKENLAWMDGEPMSLWM